ncbi:hypothetical protein GCM10009069_26600 [Algimonas arctica]|uniref:DUF3137 domain-containing protein n=1 Tax=Algimonas arctica TaxID=1479486 RepID=A0A8J3CSA9_9PROT|nr:DUF3137 domain-containing protein [Algimonas arctica]GHB02529.1 hypothetical protein GCM10009069_26600 [Algimonas arctica]
MHQFTTHHAEFDGFSDFFDREVHPELVARDSVRAKAVRNGLLGGALTAVIILAVAATVYLKTSETGIGFMIGIGAFMAAYFVYHFITHDIREETKGRIVNAIVGYVGWRFTPDIESFDTSAFRDLFLIPKKVDRFSYEDSLAGEAHGAGFRSVEAHLEKESRNSKGNRTWRTVFRGQLMTLDFPTKTFGRTIVLRDKGWFNAKKQADMKRIGLVDPVFEKLFEAYGTDQVEGRVILDPAFMQKMVDLERAVAGKNIRFGFDQDTLFIAVETKDQFEAGSMFKSLTTPDRTQKILDEVGAVFDIVDMLLKREKRPSHPY